MGLRWWSSVAPNDPEVTPKDEFTQLTGNRQKNQVSKYLLIVVTYLVNREML